MRKILSVAAFILIGVIVFRAQSEDHSPIVSDINDDDFVVFFRSSAWLDVANETWHVPIHGWIYKLEDSFARKSVLAAILKQKYELEVTDETEAAFDRRVNLLIADNERGRRIVVRIAGTNYVLPRSEPNGHFGDTVVIPVAEINAIANGNRIEFSAVTADDETRSFAGEVLLVLPTGLSVVSDIDDTVKISDVRDHQKLFENTFFRDFEAAPGMVELYTGWSEQSMSFHFVSSSPWQLYSPLVEFLDDAGFPTATLSLKSVRFRDETLLNFFKEGTETKPPQIEAIFQTYSDREFILVGDSGEQDPEVYAELMEQYPEKILKIYIRNVTGETANNDRFKSLFENIDDEKWLLFENPPEQNSAAPTEPVVD